MDTTIDVKSVLGRLGFDEAADYGLPEDLNDLSASSLRGFVDRGRPRRFAESTALIHVAGPSVDGHSAPLRSIGDFMVCLQRAVDSIGASIEGFRSRAGAIPAALAKRTELSLVASPLPGSVVLEVAPAKSRLEDLCPEGEGFSDAEEAAKAKPLVDSAFEELSDLMSDVAAGESGQEGFVDRLAKLGPRVASNVQDLCNTVDKGAIDVDFDWRFPSGARKRVSIDHAFAKTVSNVIEDVDIKTEAVEIAGTLVTVTTSDKDRLRIREDEDGGSGDEVVLSIGGIPTEQLCGLQTGDKVLLDAEQQVYSRAGGRERHKLVGIGIRRLPD